MYKESSEVLIWETFSSRPNLHGVISEIIVRFNINRKAVAVWWQFLELTLAGSKHSNATQIAV